MVNIFNAPNQGFLRYLTFGFSYLLLKPRATVVSDKPFSFFS